MTTTARPRSNMKRPKSRHRPRTNKTTAPRETTQTNTISAYWRTVNARKSGRSQESDEDSLAFLSETSDPRAIVATATNTSPKVPRKTSKASSSLPKDSLQSFCGDSSNNNNDSLSPPVMTPSNNRHDSHIDTTTTSNRSVTALSATSTLSTTRSDNNSPHQNHVASINSKKKPLILEEGTCQLGNVSKAQRQITSAAGRASTSPTARHPNWETTTPTAADNAVVNLCDGNDSHTDNDNDDENDLDDTTTKPSQQSSTTSLSFHSSSSSDQSLLSPSLKSNNNNNNEALIQQQRPPRSDRSIDPLRELTTAKKNPMTNVVPRLDTPNDTIRSIDPHRRDNTTAKMYPTAGTVLDTRVVLQQNHVATPKSVPFREAPIPMDVDEPTPSRKRPLSLCRNSSSSSRSNRTDNDHIVLDHDDDDEEDNVIPNNDIPMGKEEAPSRDKEGPSISADQFVSQIVDDICGETVLVEPRAPTSFGQRMGSTFTSAVSSTLNSTLNLFKKVASPSRSCSDHPSSTPNRSRMNSRSAAFQESNLLGTRLCRPPKINKKPSQVIRPGASLPSLASANVFQEEDPITEYPDVDYESRANRSTRASSTLRGKFGKDSLPVNPAVASQQAARDQCRNVDDHHPEPLTMTLRKRPEARKSSASSIICIDSSSDDESLVEPPKNVSAPTSIEFETFRIAIGKQVHFKDCLISLNVSSSAAALEPTMRLEFNKQTRRNTTRSRYATRLSTGQTNNLDVQSDHQLLLINLAQDLQEIKFYSPENDPLVSTNNRNDAGDDRNHLTNNLLLMCIRPNKHNGLTFLPNMYKPESSDPEKKWIVIELCTRTDMDDFLSVMRNDLTLSAFATDDCRLSQNEAESYSRSLLNDNKLQTEQSRHDNAVVKSFGRFLNGKAQDDVLLVYPFGGDSRAIDNASVGLTELSCVLEYENNNLGPTGNTENHPVTSALSATNDDAAVGAEEDNTEDAAGEESRAVLTLAVSTIERLEPGVYLNDTLIDFYHRWIWRNTEKSSVHYFTTHFFTALEKNDPESLKRWTERRGVDVFAKKFIFIPINKSLHWSFCVVVNPGAIMAHRERMAVQENGNTMDLMSADEPFPCILFFDSLKFHPKNRVAKLVRIWLNTEWKRRYPHQSVLTPFDMKSMGLFCPAIPYQVNSWDCGVYVCRYMYAMHKLRSQQFTYTDVGWFESSKENMFRDLITNHAAFQFNEDDIVRMRYELMTLIERLSKLFCAWKVEEDRRRLEARRLQKMEVDDMDKQEQL